MNQQEAIDYEVRRREHMNDGEYVEADWCKQMEQKRADEEALKAQREAEAEEKKAREIEECSNMSMDEYIAKRRGFHRYTPEEISAMSIEEYAKHRDEIMRTW